MNYVKQREFEQVLEGWRWSDYAYVLVSDDMVYDIILPGSFTITREQLQRLQNYDFKRMQIMYLAGNILLSLHFKFDE